MGTVARPRATLRVSCVAIVPVRWASAIVAPVGLLRSLKTVKHIAAQANIEKTAVIGLSAPSREVQTRTRLSPRRFLRTLKPLRSATIDINGIIATYPPALNPEVEAILDALKPTKSRH